MADHEFDRFSNNYDQILSDSMPDLLRENQYFAEYKIALLAELLNTRPPQRILDFGCGIGRSLHYLTQYFPEAELYGYDPSADSVQIATRQYPHVRFLQDAENIPVQHFDLIFSSNVFHHIPLAERLSALSLCKKALAPDGNIIIFEHNPLNPVTRYIFDHCPFDVDAEMISAKAMHDLALLAKLQIKARAYTMFFPRQLAFLRRFEPMLRWLPLGAQYYVRMGL